MILINFACFMLSLSTFYPCIIYLVSISTTIYIKLFHLVICPVRRLPRPSDLDQFIINRGRPRLPQSVERLNVEQEITRDRYPRYSGSLKKKL